MQSASMADGQAWTGRQAGLFPEAVDVSLPPSMQVAVGGAGAARAHSCNVVCQQASRQDAILPMQATALATGAGSSPPVVLAVCDGAGADHWCAAFLHNRLPDTC
jgi:hypothetical protein